MCVIYRISKDMKSNDRAYSRRDIKLLCFWNNVKYEDSLKEDESSFKFNNNNNRSKKTNIPRYIIKSKFDI